MANGKTFFSFNELIETLHLEGISKEYITALDTFYTQKGGIILHFDDDMLLSIKGKSEGIANYRNFLVHWLLDLLYIVKSHEDTLIKELYWDYNCPLQLPKVYEEQYL